MEKITGPSKGLGDSIAKITHFFGIDKLAEKFANLLGKEDCGCERRKDKLNNIIPYKNKQDDAERKTDN
jgi:hypothetical protein